MPSLKVWDGSAWVTIGTAEGSSVQSQAEAESSTDTTPRLTTGQRLYQAIQKHVGTWQTFTPTWTNLTVGNGTNFAKYTLVGKTVTAQYDFTFGSTTTVGGGGLLFHPSLPFSMVGFTGVGSLWAFDTSASAWTVGTFAAGSYMMMTLPAGGAARATQSSPWIWATGDIIRMSVTYEAA